MLEIQTCVDPRAAENLLRLLHVDMLNGAHDFKPWRQAMDWFPHLKYRDEVTALTERLPADWKTGQLCDPQILLHFPHVGPTPEITYHLDKEPDWAEGRRYLRIVGVPLNDWTHRNGSLLIQDRSTLPPLTPGQAICMSPDLWHSPGINWTGSVRYGVYFRWIENEEDGLSTDPRPGTWAAIAAGLDGYHAINILEILKVLPDTGDWHGSLRISAEMALKREQARAPETVWTPNTTAEWIENEIVENRLRRDQA